MAVGIAAGQFIILIASPILTRLYGPEDFGVLAVFASLLGVLGVIASLRYQLAIPLPENDEEAANVTVLSLVVVLGMALLTAAITIPLRHPIAEALNTPLLAKYIWLLPLGLLLMGIYQVFNYWAIRAKAYSVIARAKLTQSLAMVAVQVLGYAIGPLALLLGRVVGQAAATTTLGSLALVNRREAFRHTTLSGVRKASARYCDFPLYSSWAGLLNAAGIRTPPLLFAIFYSANAAGLYMLASRVITLPMALVGAAIADVFVPNAVEAVRGGRLRDSVASLQRHLAWIALPPAALLFLAAPEAFRIVFGAGWEQAGHMVRWLTPMLFLQFIVSPLARIFTVLEKQRLGLVLQANLCLLRLGSIVVSGYKEIDLLDAVIWYGVASAFGYFVYLVAITIVTGNAVTAFVKKWISLIPGLALVLSPWFVLYFSLGSSVMWMQIICLMVSLTFLLFYYKRDFS